MSFKELPYSLKGGITTVISAIILFLLLLVIPKSGCNSKPLPEGYVYEECSPFSYSEILILPGSIFLGILKSIIFIHNDLVIMSIIFLFSVIFYFSIGALLGWLYEKIKDIRIKQK